MIWESETTSKHSRAYRRLLREFRASLWLCTAEWCDNDIRQHGRSRFERVAAKPGRMEPLGSNLGFFYICVPLPRSTIPTLPTSGFDNWKDDISWREIITEALLMCSSYRAPRSSGAHCYIHSLSNIHSPINIAIVTVINTYIQSSYSPSNLNLVPPSSSWQLNS